MASEYLSREYTFVGTCYQLTEIAIFLDLESFVQLRIRFRLVNSKALIMSPGYQTLGPDFAPR